MGEVSASTSTSGGVGMQAAPVCTVPAGALDAEPPCGHDPPWSGLTLVQKWSYALDDDWEVENGPLVANLTDDDGDGVIDLCDTPDVLVEYARGDGDTTLVKYVVLSGADGSLEYEIQPGTLSVTAPAVADLDGDGVPEIIAPNADGHLMALDPHGTLLWEGSAAVFDPIDEPVVPPRDPYVYASAIAVADLDGDGVPEIMSGLTVADQHGDLLFDDPTQGTEFMGQGGPGFDFTGVIRPIAADLDGDGTREVLFGHVAYRADGSELFRLATTPGFSAVGNFLGRGDREVLVASHEGLTLVSSNGDVLWGPLEPEGDSPPLVFACWVHPPAAVDIDGDGRAEALVNTCTRRMVVELTDSGPVVVSTAPLSTNPASLPWASGSTAFAFRDDHPSWIAYHDSVGATVFDAAGPAILSDISLGSIGSPHVPVIADIDDDGSADVLLLGVSQSGFENRVFAYGDLEGRPSPARRIWNQWNYVASEVREDARPVSASDPHTLGGFRVQSRLGCALPPR
jgi:hypothetical protein